MKNQEECISDFAAKNILERVRTLVKDLSRPCSVDEPLVVLIIASTWGVVQRADLHDSKYEVSPSVDGEGADIRCLLRKGGFACQVRRRTTKPLKAKIPKGTAPPSLPHSNPVVELLFLVYPAPTA